MNQEAQLIQFQRGCALYHHGQYWEAHEVWEALWHLYPKTDPNALLIQGLILHAAAMIKWRIGNRRGVELQSHKAWAKLDDPRVLTEKNAISTLWQMDLAEFKRQLSIFYGILWQGQPFTSDLQVPCIPLRN